jgi:xylulose-5-phosphate/fructose-6-phosphate phosphoketolase
MDDREMAALFTGYGYQPRVVEDLDDIDGDLNISVVWALSEIRKIKKATHSSQPIVTQMACFDHAHTKRLVTAEERSPG